MLRLLLISLRIKIIFHYLILKYLSIIHEVERDLRVLNFESTVK